jgi:flavin-dependent dehydrogenase/geranylgeranyl pyrophosphate synthase
MVDRSVFPRDKACGDGLTRTSVELLADLGVLEKFKSSTAITGAQLINRGGTHHNAPYRPRGPGRPGYGLVVPRIELDNILRKHAMAAGAELWEQFRATQVIRVGDRLDGIRGHRAGEQFDLRARFLIFADGGAGSVARQLGLGVANRMSTGFAVRGYYTDITGLEPVFQMHVPLTDPLDNEIVPGYGWVFPLSDTDANIGVGFFIGQQRDLTLNLRRLFDRFLVELTNREPGFAAMRRVGELRGAPLNCGLDPARSWRPQALVIGDAAGLVDPFTGEGIDTALESGKCAAEVVSFALDGHKPQRASLADYEHLLEQRFRDRFETGRKAIKTYFFTWKLLESTLEVRRPLFRALRETLLDYGTQEEARSSAAAGGTWSWLEPWTVLPFVQDVEADVASIIRAEYAILAQAAPTLVDPAGRLARIVMSLITSRYGRGDMQTARIVAAAVELGYLAQQVQFDIVEDKLPRRHSIGDSEPNWSNRFAIMVGAYLLAKSNSLLGELGAKPQALAGKTSAEACEAWLRERSYGRGRCPESVYLEVLPLKVGCFFGLGSRLSGTVNDLPELFVRALESFGNHLGIALHLQNEVKQLLDGGRSGDHPIIRLLESGSYSLPMLRAQLSNHLPLLMHQDIDEQTVEQSLVIVHESGALKTTWQLSLEFAERAHEAAGNLPDLPETQALLDLVSWLSEGSDPTIALNSPVPLGRASRSPVTPE